MIPIRLRPLLPSALLAAVGALHLPPSARLSEIRVRGGRRASLSLFLNGELVNLPLPYVADGEEVNAILGRACGGSVYAFEEELREGYVSLGDGVRLGVCGRAVVKEGALRALSTVDSLVFRLPTVRAAEREALAKFFLSHRGGILLFSPPGGGKTTALRGFVDRVAKELRVAVVDTRGELYGFAEDALVDVLSGYPKAKGTEIAVRTLSPQVLVLDEIGSEEARSLRDIVSLGVRVVATAHAATGEELLSCESLRELFSQGLFSYLWDVVRDIPVFLKEEKI
ncbi:MAG: hypothetical protein J6S44_03475 [Clostridia bacterium]|nr:hypothetical protein [Clostridia bacterium]